MSHVGVVRRQAEGSICSVPILPLFGSVALITPSIAVVGVAIIIIIIIHAVSALKTKDLCTFFQLSFRFVSFAFPTGHSP
ncbi:unnamed protein product [Linum trigynum]|uniref:Uncharacterized protein n=1 Tax=Linum trigynum TaxID=586398 RepID=A0AAV2GXX7_9ROSI